MDSSSKPNRTTSSSGGSTSELFICSASRLSSSSAMKLSSKSILSPGRSREPAQISLSTSLSRRLRSNGSMKGGQASPMFPTGGKKRGCAFENPEPSSPKVTCIGQVRVKTKKQGKRMRTISQRRGEASYRKTEQNVQVATNPDLNPQNNQAFQYPSLQQDCLSHRNQRWVHIPVTICEALRAFGAEFNCFLPCRSSCMSSEKRKEKEAAEERSESSCGAVCRWLVSLQGDGKGREIELVVGEEERVERSSRRRHIFDELEFQDDDIKTQGMDGEEEKAKVSICMPPKNALLLMRCRSDPVKMAALANKFWNPVERDEDEDDEGHEDYGVGEHMEEEVEQGDVKIETGTKAKDFILFAKSNTLEVNEVHDELEIQKPELEAYVTEFNDDVIQESSVLSALGGENVEETYESESEAVEEKDEVTAEEKEEEESQETEAENVKHLEEQVIPEPDELQEEEMEERENEEANSKALQRSTDNAPSGASVLYGESQPDDDDLETKFEALAEKTEESMEQHEKQPDATSDEDEEAETVTLDRSLTENSKLSQPKSGLESNELESQREPEKTALPDCLLLMMYEPKLSMEVSKETWVCSADFIRWLPKRPVRKTDGADEPPKQTSTEPNPPPQLEQQQHHQQQLLQPPRSSCSYPEATAASPLSMATVIEKKLVGSHAYEPFVLTRCKSEPMRSSSTFAPEPRFWNNGKIEAHRPANVGFGAARVGC